jgi:hypothetical protein
MGKIVGMVFIGISIYTLIKKGIKEAIAVFVIGCILASAIDNQANVSLLGDTFWGLLKELTTGLKT